MTIEELLDDFLEIALANLPETDRPQTTYLTLCGEGYVRGVQPGRYVNGRESALHAITLARVLVQDLDLADASTARLWKLAGGAGKTENDQADDVVALCRAGLLVEPPLRT